MYNVTFRGVGRNGISSPKILPDKYFARMRPYLYISLVDRFKRSSRLGISQGGVMYTSDFSPESLPLKVVLFQQLYRSEVFNPEFM